MQFAQIKIENWRQFSHVDVRCHPRLTILTGTNGSGKTTLLNMLSRSIGWQVSLLAMPNDEFSSVRSLLPDIELPFDHSREANGVIVLANGQEFNLGINASGTLAISYGPLKGADGVYITSHRQLFSYSLVKSIPTNTLTPLQLLSDYSKRARRAYTPAPAQEVVKDEDSPAFRLKQSLISLATFGEGNSIVQPNPQALQIFRGFEDTLRFVLPDEIGFQRLLVKVPEVYVVGQSGVFPLEATSGGMAATIDLTWQVFLASLIYDDFVVLIDEPENHLHPSLQKRLLGDLVAAFPRAQFIVATHSPLMINSVRDSAVFVLSPDAPGRVSSKELDFYDRSSSAQETLQNVLGVDGMTPHWARRSLEELIAKYSDRMDDDAALRELRDELRTLGLGSEFSRIIERLVDKRQ